MMTHKGTINKKNIFFTVLGCFAFFFAKVQGHGFLKSPSSRNFHAYGQGQDYCPHCKNTGPSCGDGYNNAAESYSVLNNYQAGSVIEFDVTITAHHRGHFELSLCEVGDLPVNSAVTESCLTTYQLFPVYDEGEGHPQPVDNQHPERFFLPPPCDLEPENDFTHGGRVTYKTTLPDIDCSHCVIRW
mmetsp:Transcript_8342/g.12724  ORF Transcript_8342/g.12724 Transcript_8342/m.12724 type:complete len:186 (+) Transcript_8342:96-653(+)